MKDVLTRLEEAGMALVSGALAFLFSRTNNEPILCAAIMLHADGKSSLLAIPNPDDRIEGLKQYVAKVGNIVGFALLYDGYVSSECTRCHAKGCEHCTDGLTQPKVDALITIIRDQTGAGILKSVAYQVVDGKVALLPERNDEIRTNRHDTSLFDNYNSVFKAETVN